MKNLFFPVIIFLAFSCRKKEQIIPQPGDGVVSFTVRAVFQIGDIVYDSVPADLLIKSWDDKGQLHFQNIQLSAGDNAIVLPLSFVKNEFTVSHWDISATKTSLKGMITAGANIILGGSRSAKRLKSETVYKNINGNEVLKNKIEYAYNANNRLSKISYFESEPQTNALHPTGYIEFIYAGELIVAASRYTATGVWQSYTEFKYNNNKAIVHMHEMATTYDIVAAAEHKSQNGLTKIIADYLYTNGLTAAYEIIYKGGNRISDSWTSSSSSTATVEYSYDMNINPFVHLKLPDLYFTNSSRNNVKTENQLYQGNIPSGAVPYSHNYWIGTDGYPVEKVSNYKSHSTGKHVFNTRTAYNYY